MCFLQDHFDILASLSELIESFKDGRSLEGRVLLGRLTSWLTRHTASFITVLKYIKLFLNNTAWKLIFYDNNSFTIK